MDVTEVLTTYWSQTVLIFAGLSYLVKHRMDSNSKKSEINHSLFQEQKLKATINFFAQYSQAELLWQHLSVFDVLEKRLSASEVDKIIYPVLDGLKTRLIELNIYFNQVEVNDFQQIVDNMNDINGKLFNLYFEREHVENEADKYVQFNSYKSQKLMQTKPLIIELTTRLRNDLLG